MADEPFNVGLALLIAVDLLANALSFTMLFPFSGLMVVDLVGCSMEEAGYYAGWLVSSMMIGRTVSAVPWGWFSDRYGRKPVMVWGNLGISACAILFGCSTSLACAIAARAIMGLIGGGLPGTAKTCVGELFPERHQPRAMGALGATWGVGIAIGPVLGGWLARPYGRLPAALGGSLPLFLELPYLLPCIALSVLSALSAAVTQLFLPEALHALPGRARAPAAAKSKGKGKGRYAQLELGTVEEAPGATERLPASPAAEQGGAVDEQAQWYREGPFVSVMVVYAVFSFANLMLDEAYALFALAVLRWDAVQIGSASATTGLPLIAFQLLAFPPIVKKCGLRGTLFAFGLCLAPAAMVMPATAKLAGGAQWAVLVAALVFKTCIGSAGFTCLFMLGNNAVRKQQRGVANGWGTVISALAKAAGPAVGAPVFAWSVSTTDRSSAAPLAALRQRLGHYLVFVLTAGMCLLATAVVACSPPSLDHKREEGEEGQREGQGASEGAGSADPGEGAEAGKVSVPFRAAADDNGEEGRAPPPPPDEPRLYAFGDARAQNRPLAVVPLHEAE